MKVTVRKTFSLFFILMALLPFNGMSQNLTGIWRGWFKSEGGESYKCEIQIAENKRKSIRGVSYSYLDTRFYGKATLSGFFNKKGKTVVIQEIKTVEVKMSDGVVAIMKYLMNYSKSGKEEFLEGNYSSKYEKTRGGFKKGEPGGGGYVFLRKVTTSDFYTEPFLRNKIKTNTVKPIMAQKKATIKQPAKPQSKLHNIAKTAIKKPAIKKSTTKMVITETVKRNTNPVVIDKPKEASKIIIPETTRSRENSLVRTLIVTKDDINIRLYDNGEVDGDTISVYLDGKPLLMNKRLSTKPISLTLKMDENNADHTLVMVAENMGRIPPNTSLMIVQDGDNRYQVSITSTEQKNAMVRFRYQRK